MIGWIWPIKWPESVSSNDGAQCELEDLFYAKSLNLGTHGFCSIKNTLWNKGLAWWLILVVLHFKPRQPLARPKTPTEVRKRHIKYFRVRFLLSCQLLKSMADGAISNDLKCTRLGQQESTKSMFATYSTMIILPVSSEIRWKYQSDLYSTTSFQPFAFTFPFCVTLPTRKKPQLVNKL